jgi:hypothetical protein
MDDDTLAPSARSGSEQLECGIRRLNYGRFYRSKCIQVLRHLNEALGHVTRSVIISIASDADQSAAALYFRLPFHSARPENLTASTRAGIALQSELQITFEPLGTKFDARPLDVPKTHLNQERTEPLAGRGCDGRSAAFSPRQPELALHGIVFYRPP